MFYAGKKIFGTKNYLFESVKVSIQYYGNAPHRILNATAPLMPFLLPPYQNDRPDLFNLYRIKEIKAGIAVLIILPSNLIGVEFFILYVDLFY